MRSGEARKHLRVSRKTLIGYAKRGRISTVELPGGSKRVHRLYDVSGSCVKGGNDAPKNDMVVEAIYTRAPEGEERRVEVDTLRQQCGYCHGGVVVFADAPGDYDGIRQLLDRVIERGVRVVHVARRDYLCGENLSCVVIEYVIEKFGCRLCVANESVVTT